MSIAERRGNGELKNFTIMTLKSAWDAWVFFGPFGETVHRNKAEFRLTAKLENVWLTETQLKNTTWAEHEIGTQAVSSEGCTSTRCPTTSSPSRSKDVERTGVRRAQSSAHLLPRVGTHESVKSKLVVDAKSKLVVEASGHRPSVKHAGVGEAAWAEGGFWRD